jgi:hypothetical protein
MAIQDDFSISATGDIRYTGSTANYTVIQLHRWLGDLMDDAAAAGNDILDITDATASERQTDNIITLKSPYNIDDTAAEHLYDGSIIQSDGDTIYDGILVFAAAGMYLDIIQNGAVVTNFWTTGLNADAANGISHRFMLKVRDSGTDIDGRRVIGQTREFGYTYSEFRINGTSRGNNVMALTYASDLNNQTSAGTVAGWTTIANTEGYRLIDVNNDTSNEAYYSEWDRDTYTINQFYERIKWLTRRGSASTIYGTNGALVRGITHEVALTTPRSGTFSATENVSWGSGGTAGTGLMFAIDSTTAGTKMWIQLKTGVAPSASVTITGASSSATATNSGTPTERTLSFPLCGASTGSAIIGSYGFGIQAADLTASDKVFDLTNTQRTPPNYVTFTVGGLVSTEDRILVGPADGGLLDEDQFTLNGALTGTAVTSVVVGASIPTDTPSSGTIRIELDSGIYRRVPYSSYTSATFTIGSTITTASRARNSNVATIVTSSPHGLSVGDTFTTTSIGGSGYNATATVASVVSATSFTYSNTGSNEGTTADTGGTIAHTACSFSGDNASNSNNVYISYIDKLADATTASFTSVYASDRSLFIRVRDGGVTPIKTFETTGTLGSAGGSSTAIRTSDT